MRHYSRAEWSQVFDDILGQRLPVAPDQLMLQQTTDQRFEIGSRRKFGNWTCHYMYAGAAITMAGRGIINANGVIANGEVLAVANVGDYFVAVPDAASAAHAYKNGVLDIFPLVDTLEQHRIKDNTVHDAVVAGATILELYEPLQVALTIGAPGVGTFVSAYYSQYADVRQAGIVDPEYESFVGVPLVPILALRYFWGVTYGPVFCTWVGGVETEPGRSINNRDVYFAAGGTISSGLDRIPGGLGNQRAGYILPTTNGGATGEEMFMLQLDP